MRLFPSKPQWKSWTLPSKAGYIALPIAIIGTLIAITGFVLPITSGKDKPSGNTHPKLILLKDKTKSWKDENSLFHTTYFFESKDPVPLRHISIEMKFDADILDAESIIIGGIAIDNGSRISIASDKRGFTFVTDLLIVGNKIMIEIISKNPLNRTYMKLFPS